ncbi:MAG: sodium-dependent transporter [Pseudomonadota bacterium]
MRVENWSGRLAFILASIGAAVGLGNIWKFPYTLGSSGGSAFVLVYIGAILLIATPIMMAEMIIGRRGRGSAPTAVRTVALDAGASKAWSGFGWMGLFAVFLVLSFYSVIAGWTLAYLLESVTGGLQGLSAAQVGQNFNEFLADPLPMLAWHLLFTAITVGIVSRGVRSGLEPVVKVLMPGLFLMLLGLVVYAAFAGEFAQTLAYLFKPDFALLTAPVVLAAVGQAFFSVNVGIGAVITYAAYLPANVNLFRSALTVSLGDTLVALLAGLAIFPIVFANNLDPGEGPGLVFVTLATAFASMPGGGVIGTLFFVMLLFAALTSAISMLEMTTARTIESGRLSRPIAAAVLGSAACLVGVVTALSFSVWSDVHLLGMFETFAGKTPFDLIDYLVSNVMLPLGGMGFVIFAGWCLQREVQVAELGVGDSIWFDTWLFLARFVAPAAIALVFVFNLA